MRIVAAVALVGLVSLAAVQPVTARPFTRSAIPGLAGVQISTDGRWLFDLRQGPERRQRNFPYQALFTPNDPQYNLQWHFPAINLPAAWDADTAPPLYGGDPNIVVAVLDTGLAYENYASYVAAPDTPTNIWTNPGEVADGLDNDGNSLVDDLHGWDFINNDGHPNDDNGHGTHVTGTIAQATNNSVAVAGVAFHTTILPIKVLDHEGDGSTTTVMAGIHYAIDAGADIINLSLGGNDPDESLRQSIVEATAQGLVVVGAAGNNGDAAINYPARYDEVLAVGATQSDNSHWPLSDTGPELDLVAPGQGIVQQSCTSGACSTFDLYAYSGTSQSAAHVSGVAALLEACGVAGGAVRGVLMSTATDLGTSGADNEYGAGLINVAAALASGGCQSADPTPPSVITATASGTTSRPVIQHRPHPFDQPRFQWTGLTGAVYRLVWGKVGQTGATATTVATSYIPDITSEGSYRLSITAVDGLGRTSTTQTFTYRFRRPVLIIGQRSNTLGVRLYSGALQFIRQWTAGLGTAMVHPIGGSVDQNGTSRVLVTGQTAGRSIKVKTTRGTTMLNLVPFGTSYPGSIDAAIVERAGQSSVFVFSTRSTDAKLVWASAGGSIIRRQTLYSRYRGGIEVANGDLNGDGTDEVVAAMSNGHEVRVYDQAGVRRTVFSPLGRSFTRGWAVTTGDSDGDGNDEVILAPRTIRDSTTVFITTMGGVPLKTFRLRMNGYNGAIELVSLDADGNGRDEIFALTAAGRLRLLQLSATGQVEKDIRPRSESLGGSLGGWQ